MNLSNVSAPFNEQASCIANIVAGGAGIISGCLLVTTVCYKRTEWHNFHVNGLMLGILNVMLGIYGIGESIYHLTVTSFDSVACGWSSLPNFFFTIIMGFQLVLLSLDGILASKFPNFYFNRCRPKQFFKLQAIAWLLATVISMLGPLTFLSPLVDSTICKAATIFVSFYYSSVKYLGVALIVLSAVLYLSIFIVTCGRCKSSTNSNLTKAQLSRDKSILRSVAFLITDVIVFAVCPGFVLQLTVRNNVQLYLNVSSYMFFLELVAVSLLFPIFIVSIGSLRGEFLKLIGIRKSSKIANKTSTTGGVQKVNNVLVSAKWPSDNV